MPFQPGLSGNPAGRTKGTGSRQQIFNALVLPHKEALFNKAVALALEGNEAMLRLLLDRMLPAKPVDEPVQMDIPFIGLSNTQSLSQFVIETLRAVISGEITPTEAVKISSLIGVHYHMLPLIEFNKELDELKESLKKSDHSQFSQL